MRSGWRVAVMAGIAAVAVVVVLLVASSGDSAPAPTRVPNTPAIVGKISFIRSGYVHGQQVRAVVKLRADRTIKLTSLRIAVRDSHGADRDRDGRSLDLVPMPGQGALRLSTTYHTYVMHGVLHYAGTYTYHLVYSVGGTSHSLGPYPQLVIR